MLKKIECFLGFCDGCGDELETSDYILHLPTEGQAEEEMQDADWMVWQGHHWCENCRPSCDFCGHEFSDHDYGEAECQNKDCSACLEFTIYERAK